MSESATQNQRRKYRKPPVVEIAADFQMARSDTAEWDWEAASEFLEQIVPSGEPVEEMRQIQLLRAARRRQGSSTKVNMSERTLRMRRFSEDRSSCVQLGPDRITVNCVGTEGRLPTFSALEPAVSGCLMEYWKAFKPDGVDSISLSYVDDVTVPKADSVDLMAYFNLRVDFPPVFGGMQHLAIKGEWVTGPLAVRLELEDVDRFTFRLQWRATKALGGPSDVGTTLKELHECRAVLRDHFDASFTEAGHQLFEPE